MNSHTTVMADIDIRGKSIAIILPAYNEEQTIAATMRDFHNICPEANIHVINNASTDKTKEVTLAAYKELGCKGFLLDEFRKGKANAVKKAFMELDADIYVMADADCTYPASDLPRLLKPVVEGNADIVCGNRHSSDLYAKENKRPLHNAGNIFVRKLINRLFNGKLEDILTGYRIMSKRFVKNFPILSTGFELETEMSIHTLDKGYAIVELPTQYKDRPEGSVSKLNTIGDGVLIMKTVFSVFVKYRPLLFFSFCAFVLAMLAVWTGAYPVIEYFKTGKILRFPLAILASGLSILSMLSFATAVILNAVAESQRYNYNLSLLHWDDLQRMLDQILQKN